MNLNRFCQTGVIFNFFGPYSPPLWVLILTSNIRLLEAGYLLKIIGFICCFIRTVKGSLGFEESFQ